MIYDFRSLILKSGETNVLRARVSFGICKLRTSFLGADAVDLNYDVSWISVSSDHMIYEGTSTAVEIPRVRADRFTMPLD